jgi:hypothetical protein
MTALMPHRHELAIPEPRACTSHAFYTVVTVDNVEHNVCAPHTYLLMGQLFGMHPHYKGEDPEPGTPCEYLEVSR